MTNGEILKTFGEKYPKLRVKDYRPLAPELFTHDLKGITIWLENWKDIMGDMGKLQNHIQMCNPDSSITFGIMIARPFPRSLTDEFKNPTPLESDVHWTLEVLKPCRERVIADVA